jgi:hypothetical protein
VKLITIRDGRVSPPDGFIFPRIAPYASASGKFLFHRPPQLFSRQYPVMINNCSLWPRFVVAFKTFTKQSGEDKTMLTFLLIFLCVYLTPSFISLVNRHPHFSQILITNLLLGWSVVFWVVSFRTAMGWDKIEKKPEKS